MKKLLIIFLTTVIATTVLTGCNLLAKANGVILYGEQQDIIDSVERDKKEIIEEEQFTIKMIEQGQQKVMVLTEETAKELVSKQLIREITNQEKGKTKVAKSLSKVSEGEGLLFAKQKVEKLDAMENVKYEGNLIIGEGRAYTDMFLIVTNADYDAIEGTEKTMAVLKYDKDPSADGLKYDVEKTQLVRIEN
ncbi:lipoprotein BA_5634 family protein [Psychrobacillus sp. FSL K6-4046]|uniref:lipoprotein BA_5634 family protein n=1 Tax=unclassified Psychrobacillus TaxID=2636677 RepID=UPI0020412559|nr:lipoprotein BA_5634 family protein [Psychrobacillus sp. MER TA 171]MCM3357300.1 lipoprotein BA_5634 family protein [Psychrobacillus sp. MER TA 171]